MKKSIICILLALVMFAQFSLVSNAQEMLTVGEFVPIEEANLTYYSNADDVMGTCAAANLPEAYDSRDLGIITSVKRQGISSSCWSYSITALLEANAVKKGLISVEDADFSEAHLTWFSHNTLSSNENDVSGKDGTNNSSAYVMTGNFLIAQAALARGSGIALEKDFPFYVDKISSMEPCSEEDRYNHGSGLVIENSRNFAVNDTEGIKKWIMENGAVAVIYAHDVTYMSDKNAHCNPFTYDESDKSTYHAVAIVGWDDDFSKENFVSKNRPQSNGAWLCKNSWGTNRGDNGYFWMSYEDKSIAYVSGVTVFEDSERFNTYNHTGSGYKGFLNYNDRMRGANVFIASANEKVTSVSTWITCEENSTVEVSVYTDIPANQLPVRGKLAYKESFTVKDGGTGFETFRLSDAVKVDKGEKYAVMVSFPLVSGKSSLPAEGPVSTCTSNQDESYIFNYNLTSYMDVSAEGYNNLSIYAATECIHEYETISETESGCVTQGEKTDKCIQCKKTVTELTPVSGHTFGEWEKLYGATAVNEGREERCCEDCGYVDVKTTPKLSDNGYKVVRLEEIINSFFERIFSLLLSYMNSIEI